jgi:hypothetical protein
MASFEPPVIVSGFQPVRQIPGNYIDFFQPVFQRVVMNTSRREEPIQGEVQVVPPNVFVQNND